VKHLNNYYSLKKGIDDPLSITLERAIELITEKRNEAKQKIIKSFPEDPDLKVLNGRYGPYIAFGKNNFKIPKSKTPSELTLEECRNIIKLSEKKTTKK